MASRIIIAFIVFILAHFETFGKEYVDNLPIFLYRYFLAENLVFVLVKKSTVSKENDISDMSFA